MISITKLAKALMPQATYNHEYFPRALHGTNCFNQLPANFTLGQLLQYAENSPQDPELEVVAQNLHLSLDDRTHELTRQDRLKLIQWTANNLSTRNTLAEALMTSKHPVLFQPQTYEERNQIIESFAGLAYKTWWISRDLFYELGQNVIQTSIDLAEAGKHFWKVGGLDSFFDGVTDTFGLRKGTIIQTSDGRFRRRDGLSAAQFMRLTG